MSLGDHCQRILKMAFFVAGAEQAVNAIDNAERAKALIWTSSSPCKRMPSETLDYDSAALSIHHVKFHESRMFGNLEVDHEQDFSFMQMLCHFREFTDDKIQNRFDYWEFLVSHVDKISRNTYLHFFESLVLVTISGRNTPALALSSCNKMMHPRVSVLLSFAYVVYRAWELDLSKDVLDAIGVATLSIPQACSSCPVQNNQLALMFMCMENNHICCLGCGNQAELCWCGQKKLLMLLAN